MAVGHSIFSDLSLMYRNYLSIKLFLCGPKKIRDGNSKVYAKISKLELTG